MWQFFIGMIVYLLSTDVKTSPKYQLLPERLFNTDFISPYKTLVLGSLIYVATYSIPLPPFLLRFLSNWWSDDSNTNSRLSFTFASGLLLMLSQKDKFLCNPILSYIGAISDTLYLVHWPIYAYWKFEMESSFAGEQPESVVWRTLCFRSLRGNHSFHTLLCCCSWDFWKVWKPNETLE